MRSLWLAFCNHPNLKHIVNDYYDQELDLRVQMDYFDTGSTEWCMAEMKRHLLLKDCKTDCIEHKATTVTHSDICPTCNKVFYIDQCTSSKVCKTCGTSISIILEQQFDYTTQDRYNGNRVHHYNPSEHFSQTLSDFACIGSRRVPLKVFSYCRTVLGRGVHVSSHNVFLTLQMGGFSAYYMYKYEITNRLRGMPEFTLTSKEIMRIRDCYKRYRNEFIPFQQAHYIGKYSKMGKPRIFWPVRYILQRMCEEIGRSDLGLFIRGVRDNKKLAEYDYYWEKLRVFVDGIKPVRLKVDPVLYPVRKLPGRRR